MERVVLALALVLLALLVLAPVATMALESIRVDVVETREGKRYLGHVKDRDGNGVTIRAHGETTSRYVTRAEIAHEGRTFSLRNYRGLLAGGGERNMLLATLALAGASALVALLLGLPLGLLFAATDLPGRRLLEPLSVLPLVLPPILFAIATYHDLLDLRGPEFLRAAYVFGLTLFPLVSLFTARAVRATGADALDAARVQTTPREALFRVALGPALPGAATGALLVFTFVVADFAVPDFLGVTTAKNTITVYANAVYRYWYTDVDAGLATAAGMPPTLFCFLAFGLVLVVEARREAATLGSSFRELSPLPLGRGRLPCLLLAVVVLVAALVWPAARHLETTGGAHFGQPVAGGGVAQAAVAETSEKPASVMDGLRRGVQTDRVGESTVNSVVLAGGGALLAVLLALLLSEAGRGRPRLDRALLVCAFLPVAVPAMSFAVGWVKLVGPSRASLRFLPVFLLAARLLPFAAFAVRAVRRRVAPELLEAGAVAGLGPGARLARITLPLVAPGAVLGFLLAFLFGLREVDALVFTRTGAETLPVQLYGMIHYGYDVQVAALSFLWMAGVALFLLVAALLAGPRFRLLP
ncbi:MAG: ABC transporter permease [Planctomycetota bacterium]